MMAGRVQEMLDERKTAILHAVVQEYIETAQPVGSGRVAKTRGVDVSSATVRNEMVVLEELGYLAQPHTSAGRIPTDKGYRFFVDRVRDRSRALVPADRQQVRDFFESTHGEIESMLSHTTDLLSDLTDWTGVVVGPSSDSVTVRSAQLVDLASHVVLVVAVLSNGVIEKRTIEVADEVTPAVVADASDRLARTVEGRTLGEINTAIGDRHDPLLEAALAALQEASAAHEVFVGGASKLASAFEAAEQLQDVLTLLEQQIVVVSLIREVLDRGQRVAIGVETGLTSLADCSLVLAPYTIDGEPVGTIGVLGPTRMNYTKALSAVSAVSEQLGDALSEG